METLDFLVTGGKATAGPPIGPALGPMGVNIGQVIAKINEKTKDMLGMSVPIKLTIDSDTKEFEVEVGTPPVSALIKKELNLDKASGSPKAEKVGDLSIDMAIKIARVKSNIAPNAHAAIKQILGSCVSMGILVEGKDPRDVIKEVNEGKYDDKISGKTKLVEMSKEELDARKAELAKEAEAARAEAEAAKAAEAPEEETVAEAAEAEVQDQTHEKRDDKTSKD
jgi:large subunit ribosomal protein L11